jgi:hypothetical protein
MQAVSSDKARQFGALDVIGVVPLWTATSVLPE